MSETIAKEKYGSIDFTAPTGVRASYRDGIKRADNGEGGSGLESATVAAAKKLAGGEAATPEWARKGNRWWGRNERFLKEKAGTPAYTSAQLWGGAGGKAWFSKLVSQMDAADKGVTKALSYCEAHYVEGYAVVTKALHDAEDVLSKAGLAVPGKVYSGTGYAKVQDEPPYVKDLDEKPREIWRKAFRQALNSFTNDKAKATSIADKAVSRAGYTVSKSQAVGPTPADNYISGVIEAATVPSAQIPGYGTGGNVLKESDLPEHDQGRPPDPDLVDVYVSGEISKVVPDEMLAFGWAYTSVSKDGQMMIDVSGEDVPIDELEKGAYGFVLNSRAAGEMHLRKDAGVAVVDEAGHVVGTLVESMMFTPEKCEKLGIPPGTMPYGWWVGFKYHDQNVWKSVKDGTYKMFSIGGKAKRKAVGALAKATPPPTDLEEPGGDLDLSGYITAEENRDVFKAISEGRHDTVDEILTAVEDRYLEDVEKKVGGNAEGLRRYWSIGGEGGKKIRWGTSGDFRRCVKHLREHMPGRAEGYCQLLHKRNNGYYTGDKRNN